MISQHGHFMAYLLFKCRVEMRASLRVCLQFPSNQSLTIPAPVYSCTGTRSTNGSAAGRGPCELGTPRDPAAYQSDRSTAGCVAPRPANLAGLPPGVWPRGLAIRLVYRRVCGPAARQSGWSTAGCVAPRPANPPGVWPRGPPIRPVYRRAGCVAPRPANPAGPPPGMWFVLADTVRSRPRGGITRLSELSVLVGS